MTPDIIIYHGDDPAADWRPVVMEDDHVPSYDDLFKFDVGNDRPTFRPPPRLDGGAGAMNQAYRVAARYRSLSIGAGDGIGPTEVRTVSKNTTSHPDNLNSCSMCGELASIDLDNGRHLVSCTFCGLELSGMITRETAIELWNRMSRGHEAPYAKER